MTAQTLDVRGAAAYLGIGESSLNKMRMTGDGPRFVRAGARRVLYRVAALDEWLEAREVSRVGEKPRSGAR